MDNLSSQTNITDRVVEALQRDSRTRSLRIDVAAERGIVSLRGLVTTSDERDAAEAVARQQEGVITVINEIVVA